MRSRWVVLPADLVCDPDISALTKAVAGVMAAYGNFGDGWTFVSSKRIAADLAVSERSARRAMEELDAAGWTERRRARAEDGKLGRTEVRIRSGDHRPSVSDGVSSENGSSLQVDPIGHPEATIGQNRQVAPYTDRVKELTTKRADLVGAFVDAYRAGHAGNDPTARTCAAFGRWSKETRDTDGRSDDVLLEVAARAGKAGYASQGWFVKVLGDVEAGRGGAAEPRGYAGLRIALGMDR